MAPRPSALSITVLACLLSLPCGMAFGYPSHGWSHAKSDHFTVSYNETTVRFAARTLVIAEQTYRTLVTYLGDTLDARRFSIVLNDDSDDPNGEASLSDPVISIDCRKGPWLFRGETDWLRTVVTHELSHLYSVHGFRPPLSLNTGWGLASSAENFSVTSYASLGAIEVPMWFVEGVAQMGSHRVGADGHDALRQMLLGDAVRSGLLLSIDQMGRFEGTSRDYELAYNQGFSLLLFLETRYPEVPLGEVCRSIPRRGFENAFAAAYHKGLGTLYAEWKADLEASFGRPDPRGPAGTPAEVRGPMDLEVASVLGGEYVIANWGNDYSRYGLFHREKQGYRVVTRDTGTVLKTDPATGEVWFTKLTYNGRTGVDNDEVYRLASDGSVRQVTRGARATAFDIRRGVLVYTRYGDGNTDLVQRNSDGTESVLVSLGPDFGVQGVSLMDRDRVLVTVGAGARVQLGLVEAGQLHFLWPGAEILEAVSADGDRVVFSSTLSGRPQVYWADLANPRTWYQLTEVPAGARFPTWDGPLSTVGWSEFVRGGYRFRSQSGPLAADRPVSVPGEVFAAPADPIQDSRAPSLVPVGANPVFHLSPMFLGFFANRAENSTGAVGTSGTLVAAFDGRLYDAPEELGLSAAWQIQVPVNTEDPAQPLTYFELGLDGNLGPTRNSAGFSVQSDSYYFNQYGYEFLTYSYQNLWAQTQLQLGSDQFAGAFVQSSWETDTTAAPSITYFSMRTVGLRWTWSDSPVSVFDPAHLGQSGYRVSLGADGKFPGIEDARYFNAAVYSVDEHPVTKVLGDAAGSVLLFDSRLSIGASVGGSSYFGAVANGRLTPGVLPTLGGASSFSGYPAGYARVNTLGKGTLQVWANPLVDKSNGAEWYERLSIGALVEAGAAEYLVTSNRTLKLVYPLSAEVGLKAFFYGAANHQSSLSMRAALALNDFVSRDTGTSLKLPFQVYVVYQY